MNVCKVVSFLIFLKCYIHLSNSTLVITTWKFGSATKAAWKAINTDGNSALDAVEEAGSVCEREQCDLTVGYGGSPDERGETTLDAMIIDGDTLNMGAVGGMKRIKSAISVARHVLDYTGHSFLVGDAATDFAKSMGFQEELLSTNVSINMWAEWKKNNCQPNFWTNVLPDPKVNCGPYQPTRSNLNEGSRNHVNDRNHDTIGIIAIDYNGKVSAGTSTNGAKFKICGRVGDSPIPGSGAFADSTIGAAVGTGDGDIMMRFSPAAVSVEMLRSGASPKQAAWRMIERIATHYPNFSGAIIVANRKGDFAAACHGLSPSGYFPFTFATTDSPQVTTASVKCS